MVSILIVDDHPVVLLAVKIHMEQHGYVVVGEASNGVQAIKKACDLLPDIIILDIGLPKMGGVEVISRLRKRVPTSHIVVLTSQPSELVAKRCFSAGASGFVSKEESLDELVRAINSVTSGYIHFPRESIMSSAMQDDFGSECDIIKSLSNREYQVLMLISVGKSNKLIAEDLMISTKTVSTYKARLMEKLGVKSMIELYDIVNRNNAALLS